LICLPHDKARVVRVIFTDNFVTDGDRETVFADSLCGHDNLKVDGEVDERNPVVIYIDSNEDNEDECENNFHGYDKAVGDMQK
jgi:hypothetical protein